MSTNLNAASADTFNAHAITTPWGIDVSHDEGEIDWAKVKAAGATFAFIKASEGATIVDATFHRNWAAAKAQGIITGAYHFLRANNSVESQVNNFTSVYKQASPGDLPPSIDIEDPASWSRLSAVEAQALLFGFIEGITQRLALKNNPFIYLGLDTAQEVRANDPRLDNYVLWLAYYTKAARPKLPPPWKFWTFWQYTYTGRVDGVQGGVDIDRFNGQQDRLEALLIQ